MKLKNAYLRMKFRLRMFFTNPEKTMRRLDNLKDRRINADFYDKLRTKQRAFRNELIAEGLR